MKVKAVLASILLCGSILVLSSPASADRPPCVSPWAFANEHYFDGHYRAKACYNESTDNWQFQDAEPDSWGAYFVYPQDDLTGTKSASDTNGSLNGWVTALGSYPENHWISTTLCSYDYSAEVYHGCTTKDVLS